MRTFTALVLGTLLFTAGALAEPPRFVVDDEEYVEKVTDTSAKLLQNGKLKSLDSLRGKVRTGAFPVKSLALSHQKLAPPDLCDRLRQSTLAVGSYYKCPDCGEWHFNSSAGFVVGDVTWDVYDLSGGGTPFPSAADYVYLVGYPLLVAGTFALALNFGGRQRREGLIDVDLAGAVADDEAGG